MAIDANAMYRAGFGSKSTGRNVQVDERNARNAAITKTVFNVIGEAAIGQIKQNYQSLQEYRNASDSQTSLLNLKVDKMPASSDKYSIEESESLKGSVLELKSLYDTAARKASFGIGKGRSKGRQDMFRYMKQLTDMNAVLEIYKTSREKAQSMMDVMTGGSRREGAKDMSAGNNSMQTGNSAQLANGDLGARLRWNIETGQMEVQVGGGWQTDESTGLRTYKDKAETGTYEEYVAENQEMNLKLKQKQLTSQPEKSEAVMGSRAQVDLAGNPIETPYEESETGKFAKESLNLTPNPPMSREDWTKQNQENRGAVSNVLYKNIRFAVEADGVLAEAVRGINGDIYKMSYKKDAVKWERVSEQYRGELQAKVNEYTDDQFKDYYFGGDSFDHSTGRMEESAPAYQRLLEEDQNYGLVDGEGNWKEGHGPGSADWEGRLLTLKGQSFVKGSAYRKEATDRIFQNLKKKYTDNVKTYKTDNPEQTELANVKMNNTMMSGEDYNNAYGPNSDFMLFLNDATELEKGQAVNITTPNGTKYQRRSDGIYKESSYNEKTGVSTYAIPVDAGYIKRKENIPGTIKITLPLVNKGNGGDDPEVETPNSETFRWNLSRSERIEAVESWIAEYPDFKFDNPGTMKQTVVITAPNRKKLKIKLGSGGGSKVKQAKVFNEFMEKNKKTTETLKGRSPEEIKESVAKGEESKFNVGPDGELLSEGYTMNDLGKVVWVGVGPEPTKK